MTVAATSRLDLSLVDARCGFHRQKCGIVGSCRSEDSGLLWRRVCRWRNLRSLLWKGLPAQVPLAASLRRHTAA